MSILLVKGEKTLKNTVKVHLRAATTNRAEGQYPRKKPTQKRVTRAEIQTSLEGMAVAHWKTGLLSACRLGLASKKPTTH